jgi:hypothetical protein
MTDHKEEKKPTTGQNSDAALKPEPETLHTPDPQDEMEGPISSLVQGVKEGMKDDVTKKEADDKKNRKM